MSLPKVFESLHPEMGKEHGIAVFAITKTIFDAPNYEEFETDELWEVIDSLSQQSKYESKANIFFSPEFRKKGKSTKISALKEYFDATKAAILEWVNKDKSSLYCSKCILGQDENEDNGLLGWVNQKIYTPEISESDCSNFGEGLKGIGKVNIKGSDFVGNQSLDIIVSEIGSKFYVEAVKPFCGIEKDCVALVSHESLIKMLRSWYLSVFTNKMPAINAKEPKLFQYSIDTISSDVETPEIPEENTIYNKPMLKKDSGAISKEMRRGFGETAKSLSLEQQETKIFEWAKRSGLNAVDYDSFMRLYYPDTDHNEVLMMAMQDELYSDSLTKVVKNAKKGSLDLSKL